MVRLKTDNELKSVTFSGKYRLVPYINHSVHREWRANVGNASPFVARSLACMLTIFMLPMKFSFIIEKPATLFCHNIDTSPVLSSTA